MAGVASDGVLPGSPDIYRYLRAREPAELPDASDYIETVAKQRPFVVGLVQARMGSTRLPGKVLLPLPKEGGMPVLWHDFQRLKACKNVDQWAPAIDVVTGEPLEWFDDFVAARDGKKCAIADFANKKGQRAGPITSSTILVRARQT